MNDIEMTIGQRIKGAGVQTDARHMPNPFSLVMA